MGGRGEGRVIVGGRGWEEGDSGMKREVGG